MVLFFILIIAFILLQKIGIIKVTIRSIVLSDLLLRWKAKLVVSIHSIGWAFIILFFCMLPALIRLFVYKIYNVDSIINYLSFFNKGEFYVYSASLLTTSIVALKEDENHKESALIYYLIIVFLISIVTMGAIIAPAEFTNDLSINNVFLLSSSLIVLGICFILAVIVKYNISIIKYKAKEANLKDNETQNVENMENSLEEMLRKNKVITHNGGSTEYAAAIDEQNNVGGED
jgi:hypothetical protein